MAVSYPCAAVAAIGSAAGRVERPKLSGTSLIVAVVIAGLFLHSAWRIVGDARGDLAQARVGAAG